MTPIEKYWLGRIMFAMGILAFLLVGGQQVISLLGK